MLSDNHIENHMVLDHDDVGDPKLECSDCGFGIWPGQYYYELDDGSILCEDCFDDYIENLKKDCERYCEYGR